MISAKGKTLVIVFTLLLLTSIITVGCKQKDNHGLMNTDSLPGKAFTDGGHKNNAKCNSNIVYLGSESASIDSNFGPKDISFEFSALR